MSYNVELYDSELQFIISIEVDKIEIYVNDLGYPVFSSFIQHREMIFNVSKYEIIDETLKIEKKSIKILKVYY